MQTVKFSKYDEMGAYHWEQCSRASRVYNPPLEARYAVVVRRVRHHSHVLDIGCGDGYLMSLVSPLAKSVVGIDPEATAVALARQKLCEFKNCTVVQGDSYSLPFPERAFDTVLLADVFEHLENPGRGLQEITRVLTPNGTLFLTTPKWRSDRMWDRRHVKEYTPDGLSQRLQEHFCEIEMLFFWPLVWSKMYSTRVGWKLIKSFARYLYNPFLREDARPDRFGQILAICRQPRCVRELVHGQ